MNNQVGQMRVRTAMSHPDEKVIIVTNNWDLRNMHLQVTDFYHDIVDEEGEPVPGGVFKIQVEPLV